MSPALVKEFHRKVEEFVGKKIKDQNIADLKYNEWKICGEGGELTFKSDKLNELSDDCKKWYVGRFLQYLQYIWGAFTYIARKAVNVHDMSLLKLFNANRHKVPLILKNKLLRKLMESLSVDDSSSTVSVHVNRKKARDWLDSNKGPDDKFEHTVFA